MKDLAKTRLFALLNEPSQTVLTNEFESAYEQFAEQLRAVCDIYENAAVYRSLNVTRIELTALDSILQYGQEKKCA